MTRSEIIELFFTKGYWLESEQLKNQRRYLQFKRADGGVVEVILNE